MLRPVLLLGRFHHVHHRPARHRHRGRVRADRRHRLAERHHHLRPVLRPRVPQRRVLALRKRGLHPIVADDRHRHDRVRARRHPRRQRAQAELDGLVLLDRVVVHDFDLDDAPGLSRTEGHARVRLVQGGLRVRVALGGVVSVPADRRRRDVVPAPAVLEAPRQRDGQLGSGRRAQHQRHHRLTHLLLRPLLHPECLLVERHRPLRHVVVADRHRRLVGRPGGDACGQRPEGEHHAVVVVVHIVARCGDREGLLGVVAGEGDAGGHPGVVRSRRVALVRRPQRYLHRPFGRRRQRHGHRHRAALRHRVGRLRKADLHHRHVVVHDRHRAGSGRPGGDACGQRPEGEHHALAVVIVRVLGRYQREGLRRVVRPEGHVLRHPRPVLAALALHRRAARALSRHRHRHLAPRRAGERHRHLHRAALVNRVGRRPERHRRRARRRTVLVRGGAGV